MPSTIPAPPPAPKVVTPLSGYKVTKASDYGATNLLLQHQKTETMVKRFFAETHREGIRSQVGGAPISLDSDYHAEKLNPAHGFVGSMHVDKSQLLIHLAAQVASWITDKLNSEDEGAITWSRLKQDQSPEARALVHRIKNDLGIVLQHQEQMCGLGVQYLNAAQRAKYCVEIDNGKLHFRTYQGSTFAGLEAITSAPGGVGFGGLKQGPIWVQGPSGRFYTSHNFNVGKFHHSSFLAGNDIKAAGTWHIDRGTIKSINALSGHYKPPLEALQSAIRDLIDSGLTFTWQAVVEVYEAKAIANSHIGRKIHPEDFIKMDKGALSKYQAFPF